MSGASSGATSASAVGRVWQASLTSGAALHPGEHARLRLVRRRQAIASRADTHPTGRTPAAPAAHGGMRNVGTAACLQDGGAARERDAPAIRVGEIGQAGAPGAPLALDAQGEDQCQQREEADQEPGLQSLDQPQALGVRRIDAGHCGLEPYGVGG